MHFLIEKLSKAYISNTNIMLQKKNELTNQFLSITGII